MTLIIVGPLHVHEGLLQDLYYIVAADVHCPMADTQEHLQDSSRFIASLSGVHCSLSLLSLD